MTLWQHLTYKFLNRTGNNIVEYVSITGHQFERSAVPRRLSWCPDVVSEGYLSWGQVPHPVRLVGGIKLVWAHSSRPVVIRGPSLWKSYVLDAKIYKRRGNAQSCYCCRCNCWHQSRNSGCQCGSHDAILGNDDVMIGQFWREIKNIKEYCTQY